MWTEQGEGCLKKHVCPHGGREGLKVCPRGQKCFTATNFVHMNSNALLVSQLPYLISFWKFLDPVRLQHRDTLEV